MKPEEPPPELLTNRPDYVGAFMRTQMSGAFRNGSRIVKAKSEEGAVHEVGSLGTVLGSFCHADVHDGAMFYWIEWDDTPGWAVGCMGSQLRARS